MENKNFAAERDIELLCGYIAYMDCPRLMIIDGGLSRLRLDIPFQGRGTKETVESIKDMLAPSLDYYGFIILQECRGEYTIISGFMAYKGNVSKLESEQVKNIMNGVLGMQTEDLDRFIDSPCSIPAFSSIKNAVMSDEDVKEKELLLFKKPWGHKTKDKKDTNGTEQIMEQIVLGQINQCVDDISEILDIEPPAISFSDDTNDFTTPTEMAHYCFNGDYILFNSNYLIDMGKNFPYIVFTVAHELRHVWQSDNWESPFSNHKSSKELSLSDYNKQEEELDANAFAMIVTGEIFGDGWDHLHAMEKLYTEDFKKKLEEVRHWFFS